jgi:hypothetical protein
MAENENIHNDWDEEEENAIVPNEVVAPPPNQHEAAVLAHQAEAGVDDQGGDEMDKLRQQLAAMTTMMKEIEKQLQRAQQLQQGPPVIHVNMPSSKRLNTFTGLAPKSKDEVDFFEFERQSKQLLQDASIHNAK